MLPVVDHTAESVSLPVEIGSQWQTKKPPKKENHASSHGCFHIDDVQKQAYDGRPNEGQGWESWIPVLHDSFP
eukprot:Skav225838  [mRNA]  locus=scaffold345:93391:93883:- [translate_table: standard]